MEPGQNSGVSVEAAALRCRRFWLPRGTNPDLSDDGFLFDPEKPRSRFASVLTVALEDLNDVPVLGLLGEPGIGKSTVFKQEAQRLDGTAQAAGDKVLLIDLTAYASDFQVREGIFESSQFRAWRSSENRLYLLLDGLDTCGCCSRRPPRRSSGAAMARYRKRSRYHRAILEPNEGRLGFQDYEGGEYS